jgi:hypothetical protein
LNNNSSTWKLENCPNLEQLSLCVLSSYYSFSLDCQKLPNVRIVELNHRTKDPTLASNLQKFQDLPKLEKLSLITDKFSLSDIPENLRKKLKSLKVTAFVNQYEEKEFLEMTELTGLYWNGVTSSKIDETFLKLTNLTNLFIVGKSVSDGDIFLKYAMFSNVA